MCLSDKQIKSNSGFHSFIYKIANKSVMKGLFLSGTISVIYLKTSFGTYVIKIHQMNQSNEIENFMSHKYVINAIYCKLVLQKPI